jgi:predicted glycogen debranching enzyme
MSDETLGSVHARVRQEEADRRTKFPSRLHRSADAYIVDGRHGKTVVAGFPWFTDWGRDTFIALRGLCLAVGRLDDARDILVAWAGAVDEGMLPNLFPDQGDVPQFNSVDASLWYIIGCYEYLEAMKAAQRKVRVSDRDAIVGAIQAILTGYSSGTRYRIHRDEDGLLAAGEPGVQLTWMDAKVGDWVVTPRIGKPVEVQALWLNSLWVGSQFSNQWQPLFDHGKESFEARFWNPDRNCLYDIVDPDHRSGEFDDSLRPNQILAVGGLPLQLVVGDRARQIVDHVEEALLTPIGLRSLEPGASDYASHYRGGVRERDGSYHQGTVWPWLIGPFVEAWIRVRGNTEAARQEAREKFLSPLTAHLDQAGLGHVSEIADADYPHTPRGCPFQAWSIGELLRLSHVVLAPGGKIPAKLPSLVDVP